MAVALLGDGTVRDGWYRGCDALTLPGQAATRCQCGTGMAR